MQFIKLKLFLLVFCLSVNCCIIPAAAPAKYNCDYIVSIDYNGDKLFALIHNGFDAVKKAVEADSKLLLEINDEGDTLLMIAIRAQTINILSYLFSKGASVKINGRENSTPLQAALFGDINFPLLELLLQNKADPYQKGFLGLNTFEFIESQLEVTGVLKWKIRIFFGRYMML